MPLNLISFGVGCDVAGKKYHLWWLSSNNIKVFLADNKLTEDKSEAIETSDINFALEEQRELMKNKDFLESLESCFLF